MKLKKLKNSIKEFFSLDKEALLENKNQINELMIKLYEKRKNIEKKIKKCNECEEKKELNKKFKAVNKLIKKAKKNF